MKKTAIMRIAGTKYLAEGIYRTELVPVSPRCCRGRSASAGITRSEAETAALIRLYTVPLGREQTSSLVFPSAIPSA